MNYRYQFKLALFALVIVSDSARAQSTSTTTGDVTPEYLLKVLVQIATQEDLSDEKRIGELLKIDIELIPEEPRVRDDGQISLGADAKEPFKPSYLWPSHSSFDYRRWIAPKRSGMLSLVLNSSKVCLSVQDIYSALARFGRLKPFPAPGQVPPPPGTSYPPIKKDQPIYGYGFEGQKTSASLTFRYTKCLVDIQLVQPARNN